MAITYPILFPVAQDGGTIIQSYNLRMVEKIGVTESPFTFKQQFQDYGAMRWELDIKTVPLFGEDARNVRGFLKSLRGRLGTFQVSLPQSLSNHYRISVAGSIGDDNIDITNNMGVTPDHDFTRGTYFSLSNRLYMALEDYDANSNTNIEITPKLRTNIAPNDSVYTTNSIGSFRLSINDPSYEVSVNEGHSLTIPCHEVI